jgi:hypothetical protein
MLRNYRYFEHNRKLFINFVLIIVVK